MPRQFQHPLLPQASHDEDALQSFVISMRGHISATLTPGNRAAYERDVAPAYRRAHGHAPRTRHEVRRAMLRHPFHQSWSSIIRTTQEMIWDSPGHSALRQIDALNAAARTGGQTGGTLTLDPTIGIPPYLSAVDIHCMPGNFQQEVTDDADVYAAALYDRGVYIYIMGGMGPLNDALGHMMVDHVKREFPDLKPRRILDMGCGIGTGTLPFVDAFPDAEVHGIDVAAPMLRYAHARSEALGRKVHYTQMNAERTDFPDAHFDLVMTHIVVHETSHKALRNILRECRRLLKPGGVTLHCETPMYDARLSPFDQSQTDWDTYFNNEPFVGPMHGLDADALMREAGFAEDELANGDLPLYVPGVDDGEKGDDYRHRIGGYLSIIGARRRAA
jgi:SAM-dependent methyltransferase